MTEILRPKMVGYPAGAAAIEERFRILREHDDYAVPGKVPASVGDLLAFAHEDLARIKDLTPSEDDPVEMIRIAALLLVAADRIIVPLEERR